MTKEECLNKHDTSRHYIEQTCRPELFSAMDEWALQFGKWLQGCGYYNNKFEEDIWLSHDNSTEKTTEELYQLFLKLHH